MPHLRKTPKSDPKQTAKKAGYQEERRIGLVSPRQTTINYLSRLLKRAALLRDGFQCVMCGKACRQRCAITGSDFGDFEIYWSQARPCCCPVKKLAMASTRT